MLKDNKIIPRNEFTQHFTNVFIKNNNESLMNAVRIAAIAVGKDIDSVDVEDILDKAVFATTIDLYSSKMMDNEYSVADLVRNHLFHLLAQTESNNKCTT